MAQNEKRFIANEELCEFLKNHRAMIFGVIGRIVPRDDIEDVFQNFSLRLFQSLGRFEGRSAFSTWAYKIAYNIARDHMRKLKKRWDGEAGYRIAVERCIIYESDPGRDVLRSKVFKDVLAKLTPEHRQAVMLRYYDGNTHAEMMKRLNLSKGTVCSRVHYGRAVFREKFLDDGGFI